MARQNLESKEKRARLRARPHPYLVPLERGLHLGYRKNKTGSTWCVRFRSNGRYIMQTIGEADDKRPADDQTVLSYAQARRKADGLACSLKDSLNQKQDAIRAGSSFTVADAVTDYLDWYRINRKAIERTENICTRHIIPALGKYPIESLTTRQIERWLRNIAQTPPYASGGRPKPPYAVKRFTGKHTKPKGHKIYEFTALPYTDWTPEMQRKRKSSANRVLTVLKAALNYAWRNGYARSQDAWARIKPFENADAPRVRHLSEKQATDLLAAASDDFRPMLKAALYTGCRYGELRRLRVKNFDDGLIHIAESKTGKTRDIPVSVAGRRFFEALCKDKATDDLLLTHEDGSPWGRSHQTRPMQAACKAAGIEPAISFHILRHTYATLLLESNGSRGMSIRDVAACLGDTVATCEKHYGHVIQESLKREVARKLPNFGGAA